MSAREIELEIKRKEIELRILRKKLLVLKTAEPKVADQGLITIANKYQDTASTVTDEDIEEITNEWDKIVDNLEKR